ncbi:PQQ-dependent sugar dehydrogenase [Aeromonas salmonicida]|uniref:PQQ-dependent sugar dehydrogenase n=3 Tax=Aeromonas salmonicida TaxID=645 RepID=UPI0005571151|nr:PQQ-dependent sugar dehydrogenase [Aeromonas salmonicida]
MFRLLVVLLCLIAPVRAITLTPLVEGLSHPWGLVLLPGGEFLISERTGRLLRIDPQGKRHAVQGLPPIANAGQGGLLDMAQDKEGWIYLSYRALLPKSASKS